MTDELPKGWVETTLGDVASAPRPKASPEDHPDLPFLGMDHIAPGGMALLGSEKFGAIKSNGGLFFDGDVLYGRMRPYLNKVHRAKFQGACSAEFIVFPKSNAVNSDFLAYLLHHRRFVNFASGLSSGDRPRVAFADIVRYPLALPPLGEQGRIVSKIDELFSRIEEGERALERVQKLVERYRQSVLKAAVTGELTREWREKRKGKLEFGKVLLARILKARREAWEKIELAKMKAKGQKPGNDDWKKKYREPAPTDTTDLPELPKGWVWASLAQLSWTSSYGTSQKCSYVASGPAVLRIPNIRSGRFDFEDVKNATVELELEASDYLNAGDLLVIRTNGSESIIGIGSALLGEPPLRCYFASYLIRFRLVLPNELTEWVNICWQSHVVRQFVNKHKATSAGQYNVSQSALMEMCLPIPPFDERNEIVDEVAQIVSRAEAALRTMANQRSNSGALRQSVLKAAFAGAPVRQDPTDEPASILLERITAERSAATAAPKRRRKNSQAA